MADLLERGVLWLEEQRTKHCTRDVTYVRDAADHKLASLDRAVALVAAHRRAGHTVVFTNGCFDLLHVGHVTLLQEAARLGDVLVVAVNSDAGVRRLKGPGRPVIGAGDRARLLAALECVDHVLVFDDDTPHRLLDALRPDVLVKGGTTADIVGREVVEAYGGRVLRTAEVCGFSTTSLLSAIRASASRQVSLEVTPCD